MWKSMSGRSDATQLDAFAPASPGPGYDPKVDKVRLTGLLLRVVAAMDNNRWHTIPEVAQACGGSETGTSASMRRLRRPECGGWTLERRRHPEHGHRGLWQYRLRSPK